MVPLQHLYDIRTFAIPLLPEEKETQIQQKITESFNLRKQSKHLLECAKRAIEIAIEQPIFLLKSSSEASVCIATLCKRY